MFFIVKYATSRKVSTAAFFQNPTSIWRPSSSPYWANGSVNYKFCFDTNAICWQKIAEPLILHLEWLIIGWYFLQLQLCNMHFILFGAVLQEIHLQATKWFDIEILEK